MSRRGSQPRTTQRIRRMPWSSSIPTSRSRSPTRWAIWFENPVIYAPVKLQGIGPGGVYAEGTGVLGSVLDGRGVGGDTPYTEVWRTLVGDIWLNRGGWDGSPVDGDGNPRIYEGPVVTVFAKDGEFTACLPGQHRRLYHPGRRPAGLPQQYQRDRRRQIPGVPAEVVVQGGGIFVNGYAGYLRITNNLIQSNGGAYAGAIRLGTPDMPEPSRQPERRHPHRPQPHPGQRRHQPGRRHRRLFRRPRATKSPTTTSAATSRSSTAAASATMASAPAAASTTTASTLTAPTTRVAAS